MKRTVSLFVGLVFVLMLAFCSNSLASDAPESEGMEEEQAQMVVEQEEAQDDSMTDQESSDEQEEAADESGEEKE